MRFASKTLMMILLTFVLLAALGSIGGVVHDRQRYRAQAVEEIARSTAHSQLLEGPVLFVPYSDRVVVLKAGPEGTQRRVEETHSGTWLFFPESLEVKGAMQSLPRMRGLYEVRVFELGSAIRARFNVRIPADDDPSSPRTIGTPRLGVGISDVRGLVGEPTLQVTGVRQALRQGQGTGRSGLHALLATPAPGAELAFDVLFKSSLQGTETLSIAPLGGRNVIELRSPWRHPRFHGDFLPRSRSVASDGFTARWEVSSLASDAQSQYRAGMNRTTDGAATEAISVTLIDPVNIYSQVDRATKYGLLFVLLTFGAFFLFELFRQLRIHPVQYALVGFAIAIFFLLLLALSERIAFGLAYVVAAGACVTLIGHYLAQVLGGWRRGLGFAGMLGTLYAALYGLLISEDNAMLLGASLLFTILAAVMILTRKVDWYQATGSPRVQQQIV
jgi:inner membrane protein